MICLVESEINNFWSIWENVKVETWKIENGVNQHLDQEWGNLRFQIVVVSLGQGAWCSGSQELFRRRVSVPYAWGTWLNDFQKSESNTTWAMRLERLLPLLRWSLVRSFQLTLGGGGSLSPQLHVLQAQAMHPEETLLRWGGRKNHRIMELKMSRGCFWGM